MYMDYESYLLYFEISIGITKNKKKINLTRVINTRAWIS